MARADLDAAIALIAAVNAGVIHAIARRGFPEDGDSPPPPAVTP